MHLVTACLILISRSPPAFPRRPSRGPQGTPEALPYPILSCLSSPSPRRTAPRGAVLRTRRKPIEGLRMPTQHPLEYLNVTVSPLYVHWECIEVIPGEPPRTSSERRNHRQSRGCCYIMIMVVHGETGKKAYAMPSHGRGHRFKPCIAHSENPDSPGLSGNIVDVVLWLVLRLRVAYQREIKGYTALTI